MGFLDKIKSWLGPPSATSETEYYDTDAQDRAYQDARNDPFTDTDLKEAVEQGELELWPQDLYKTPEEYEAENWDEERIGPKTPEMAAAEDRGEEI